MNEKKSSIKPVSFIIMLVGLVASCWAGYEIMRSLILNSTIKYVAVGVLAALNILCLFMAVKAKGKVLQCILSILLMISSGAGIFALSKINSVMSYFESIFTTMPEKTTKSIYLIANKEYMPNQEIDGQYIVFGVLDEYLMNNTTNIINEISARGTMFQKLTYKDLNDIMTPYNFHSITGEARLSAMIMPDEIIESIPDIYHNANLLSKSEVKHQHSTEISTDLPQATGKDITKEVYTVLIGGNDARGIKSDEDFMNRTDLSALLTVDPVNHKLLLTIVPYDLAVEREGYPDRLTYSSMYSINDWFNSVSELLDTQIDYYARINYSSLAKLIDALGGIKVENQASFPTYQDIRTEDGWDNPQYYFDQGTVELDGSRALAFVREFYHLNQGYETRWYNLKTVYKAIDKKVTEAITDLLPESFSDVIEAVKDFDNYTSPINEIADSLNKSIATNMDSKQLIRYFAADSLDPSAIWSIEIMKLPANYSFEKCYSTNDTAAYVGTADPDALQIAIDKIHNLLNK